VLTCFPQRISSWAEPDEETSSLLNDDIDVYLNEPPIPKSSVEGAGGAMKYWYTQENDRPTLALMAMDYISAPGEFTDLNHMLRDTKSIVATSIESERQFSTGRRAMNFMQHTMSHDTFRARMALGSWDDTPLFPDFEAAVSIIETHMQ
jgi:hypothetical protein